MVGGAVRAALARRRASDAPITDEDLAVLASLRGVQKQHPGGRVQAERDRRAGDRAVGQRANDHTADLRGLAGQITALTDPDSAATGALVRLHRAFGDADATALPAHTHPHLVEHPHLADQVARVSARWFIHQVDRPATGVGRCAGPGSERRQWRDRGRR